MKWNLNKIKFLYPPDNFIGSFANEKMQARHKAIQDEKVNAILKSLAAAKDPLTAMKALNILDYMQFLLNNMEEFRNHKCLEETVLRLYCKKNSAFSSGGAFDTWNHLFLQCDARRFYQIGASFPEGEVLAFRGSISGVKKGFCWTIDKKKVDWFLERWEDKEQGGGTVFSTRIARKDILIYLNEKAELIVTPQFLETAAIETVGKQDGVRS